MSCTMITPFCSDCRVLLYPESRSCFKSITSSAQRRGTLFIPFVRLGTGGNQTSRIMIYPGWHLGPWQTERQKWKGISTTDVWVTSFWFGHFDSYLVMSYSKRNGLQFKYRPAHGNLNFRIGSKARHLLLHRVCLLIPLGKLHPRAGSMFVCLCSH